MTGFGLLGHLAEMLHASSCSAELVLDQVPFLDGAVELMRDGVESSLQGGNEGVVKDVELVGIGQSDPRFRLLMDPQTSGGLLFGMPESGVQGLIDALREAGYSSAAVIGRALGGSSVGTIRVSV